MKRLVVMTALAVGLAAAVVVAQGSGAGADRLTPDVFKGLELRSVGPGLATGRIADVTIDPKNANVIYASAYQRRRGGRCLGGAALHVRPRRGPGCARAGWPLPGGTGQAGGREGHADRPGAVVLRRAGSAVGQGEFSLETLPHLQ